MKLGALLTHPIQYYSPWLRDLAGRCDLEVFYAHRQDAEGQAAAGFGAAFEWDVPLLEGYRWRWLKNVSRRPGLGSWDGCDTPEIGDVIARGGFDAFLMFGWNRKTFIQAALGARKAQVPLLVRVDSQAASPRAGWKKLLKTPVYSFVLPRLGHYLSPGRRTDDYLRSFGVPDARIHRIPHVIDTERFARGAEAARAEGEAARLRVAHGAGADDFVFLFAGKLIAKKRPQLILDALQALEARSPGALSGVKLWFAGDGPLRAELEAFAGQHDLPLTVLGFVNQSALPAVYAAADCLVLPSDAQETWGLVVNEAFACGLPAIVSDEAGCAPELIEDGVTGWTMRSPDAGHLADLITEARMRARGISRRRLAQVSAASSFEVASKAVIKLVERLRRPTALG